MNISKRTSSIARRINSAFWLSKFKSMLFLDILLCGSVAGMIIFKCLDQIPLVDSPFDMYLKGKTYETLMLVISSTGKEYSFEMAPYLDCVAIPAIVVVSYQILDLFKSIFYTRQIRKRLKPLNDLAMKAEAISEVSLDTTKFEELEQAILKVPADKDGARITTGDKDLASIESALNNLLYRMQEARMQQTRFVDDASHELRTPIAVIQGYANMLDRWGKEDEAVLEESIEAIKNESDNMKELIDQLLFLARGDNGRQKLTMQEIDLSEIMQEVWDESVMIDTDHEYIFEGAEGCHIHGDHAMIKQSIRIFVQNASKYSAKGNTIKLSVKEASGKAMYIIQDEGIGMEQEEISHIFERFYRSDEARNSSTGGSGLGLSIAKWIIDAHLGNIEVLSRKDFGTRFMVSFDKIK